MSELYAPPPVKRWPKIVVICALGLLVGFFVVPWLLEKIDEFNTPL